MGIQVTDRLGLVCTIKASRKPLSWYLYSLDLKHIRESFVIE